MGEVMINPGMLEHYLFVLAGAVMVVVALVLVAGTVKAVDADLPPEGSV